MIEIGKKNYYLSIACSFILASMPLGSFLFTIPLLLLDKRYPKRETDTACVAVMVLVLLKSLLDFKGVFTQGLTFYFVLVALFVPFSLMLSAVAWMKTMDFDLSIRILIVLISPLVVFLIYTILFVLNSEGALAVSQVYYEYYASFITAVFGFTGDALVIMLETLEYLILSTISLILALTALFVHFVSSMIKNKNSEEFNARVSHFYVNDNVLYVFLGSLVCVFLTRFISIPLTISLILNNIALSSCVIYFTQGLSICLFKIRRKREFYKASKFMFLIVVIFFLPGMNIIFFFALTILGVAENWVKFRI